MNSVNFNSTLLDYSSRIISKNAPRNFFATYNPDGYKEEVLAELFEQLMLFDSIVVKLDMDPTPISFLINELGVKLFESCLREGIIKFVIWTPQPMVIVGSANRGVNNYEQIYGIPPVQLGFLSSEEQTNPEAIIINASKYIDKRILPIHKARQLAKNIESGFSMVSPSISDNCVKILIDSYKTNSLETLGLPYIKHENSLNYEERVLFQSIVGSILETTFLLQQDYSSFNKYESLIIAESTLKAISRSLRIQYVNNEYLKTRELPDFKKIYKKQVIDFPLAIKLRLSSEAKEYRDLINSMNDNSEDNYKLSKAYTDYVVKHSRKRSFFQETDNSFIKDLLVSILGVGIGEAIGGALGIASGLSLSIFQSLILNPVLDGKKPKVFLDQIEGSIHKKHDLAKIR